ncbi:MAG: ABC transporter permease [Anaerolineales bacterium]|jgi:osmoprotectant transport system permease protein
MVGSLFASWLRTLTQPGLETFLKEKQAANATKLLIALLLAGLVFGLISIPLTGEPVALLLEIGTLVLTVVVEAVFLSLILFVIAKMIGGEGDFLTQSYLLSLPLVPLVFIIALLGRLGFTGAVFAPLAPLGLERIIAIGLGLYGFFLSLLALQAAHDFKATRAVNVALIALLIWIVLDVVAMFVVGADNVLTKTARFMAKNLDNLLEQAAAHAWLVLVSMVVAIILGVIIGILITLPPRLPRWGHLLILIPLALFAAIYLAADGALGGATANAIASVSRRARGFAVIGIVLAVLLYALYLFGERAAQPVLYAAGIMLTFPSIGLFGLFIPLFGIGFMNAVVALILYAQLPILRNTYTGIKEVPGAIIEAGRGMGMTEFQILYKVKMPMTVPVLMAGVRVSMVMIVGIAAIAKLIGVLCLGKYIFDGIGRASDPMVIAGAVGVSIFALLVDALLGWGQHRLTPAGLREESA